MVREVAHARKRNPLFDLDKILRVVGIPDVITYANFGADRLRGLGVAWGQSLPFSIEFDRRPYNTLALPCECVIMNFSTHLLEHVGCCTYVIFLLLTKFLRNMSHLFVIILPDDYLAIAR